METGKLALHSNPNLDNRDGKQIEIFLGKLNVIDFSPTALKLIEPDEGEAWTIEEAVAAIEQYRHFLVLHFLYPDRSLVPTRIVDRVWHESILNTTKYLRDCTETFGYFLHHVPSFKAIDAVDKQASEAAFNDTCQLWERHFGQPHSIN
jgi:hypothetical protein